jgi:hypothetical protein
MLDIFYCLSYARYTLHFGRQLLYILSLGGYCGNHSELPGWSIGSVLSQYSMSKISYNLSPLILTKKSHSMIASKLKMEVMSSAKMCCVCVKVQCHCSIHIMNQPLSSTIKSWDTPDWYFIVQCAYQIGKDDDDVEEFLWTSCDEERERDFIYCNNI